MCVCVCVCVRAFVCVCHGVLVVRKCILVHEHGYAHGSGTASCTAGSNKPTGPIFADLWFASRPVPNRARYLLGALVSGLLRHDGTTGDTAGPNIKPRISWPASRRSTRSTAVACSMHARSTSPPNMPGRYPSTSTAAQPCTCRDRWPGQRPSVPCSPSVYRVPPACSSNWRWICTPRPLQPRKGLQAS